MPTLNVRVTQRIIEADGIVRLVLEGPPGTVLPGFTPGAHIDVEMGERLIRQYSLCNRDGEQPDHYQIAVLKAPCSRGGSAYLHALQPGQYIRIGLPRNSFPLAAHPKTVLLAGGIGITPLLAMAYALARTKKAFELHYSCRGKRHAAFRMELLESDLADKTSLYFSDTPGTRRVDFNAVMGGQHEDTHFYACGPSGYIQAVIDTAETLNIARERIHTEPFQPVEDTSTNRPFQVRLSSSGALFDIPRDASIADVLQEKGIDVAISCEQGICGACLIPVRAGVIEHRDSYLTDDERNRNDQMTICCSRGEGVIVLGC